jgi:hypothetical protein
MGAYIRRLDDGVTENLALECEAVMLYIAGTKVRREQKDVVRAVGRRT